MFRFNEPIQEEYDLYSYQYRESIELYGTDVKYIPKTIANETLYTGDWKDVVFEDATDMIMRIDGIDDLGNNDMYSKFGFSSDDMLTFYCATTQFDDVSINPMVGDLIYVPEYNKKVFEIVSVDQETPNQKFNFKSVDDKKVGFKLETKLHSPDLNDIYNTNVEEIDELNGLNISTTERMDNEITDKVDDNNIIDDSENDPLDE